VVCRRVKLLAVERLRATVASLWPRASVKPFGSFTTSLSLPGSDVDLVICLPKVHWEAGPAAAGVLEGRNAIKGTWQQTLARYLAREDWCDPASIRAIPHAAVPVLKVCTRPGCFPAVVAAGPGGAEEEALATVVVSLDISFEGPTHRGLPASKVIASLLARHAALRPLVLVLKCHLTRRSLCESFTGGLSSYSLLLLVARFLQQLDAQTHAGGGGGGGGADLGALLLGFLQFFGERFDSRAAGVSVRQNCYFSRTAELSGAGGAATSSVSPLAGPDGATLQHFASVDRRHSFNHGGGGGGREDRVLLGAAAVGSRRRVRSSSTRCMWRTRWTAGTTSRATASACCRSRGASPTPVPASPPHSPSTRTPAVAELAERSTCPSCDCCTR
jgi:hypothetical protein